MNNYESVYKSNGGIENMKYKVGDRVRIKSLDWYNDNKNKNGQVKCGTTTFDVNMQIYCGSITTIYAVDEIGYDLDVDWGQNVWTDEMIECKVEDDITNIDEFQDDNEIIDIIDEYVHRLKNNECQINLPESYQFVDENGNVINATKIVLEKKKKEYPKTYVECAKIFNEFTGSDCNPKGCMGYMSIQLTALQKLLICRDAYWKIAGEEMGLGKPWKPDWTNLDQLKYCIWVDVGEFVTMTNVRGQHILAFPTKEMRDAFYVNFKEEIEICKELL